MSDGEVLGWRAVESSDHPIVEVIFWVAPFSLGQCGLYVGCRIHYEDDFRTRSASIFCFYDGTSKSPCFKTRREATKRLKQWAQQHGVQYKEPEHG